MNYLPYLVARSAAHSMDRRGPPGRILTFIIMVPITVAMIGLAGVALVAIGTVLFSII